MASDGLNLCTDCGRPIDEREAYLADDGAPVCLECFQQGQADRDLFIHGGADHRAHMALDHGRAADLGQTLARELFDADDDDPI